MEVDKGLVSVVIVNYNRREYLARCLEAVKNQTYRSVEIIVVDNHSGDGSVEMVKAQYPEVRLLINPSNEFYCRAQNRGIRMARGEYILPLNNDAFLESHYVQELVRVLRKGGRIGMASGKIFLPDGKTIDSAGQSIGKSRKPIDRGYREKDTGQFDTEEAIFGPGGIAPLFRREALEEACIEGEYFDESFEIFYEDLDIAWRLNLLGWKAVYTPKAVAFHVRGGTAKKRQPNLQILEKYNLTYLSSRMTVFLIRNRYLTVIKNDSWKALLFNIPHILFYEAKLWIYILFMKPHIIFPLLRTPKYIRRAFQRRRLIRNKVR